jgi:hypothetical protein
MGLSAAQKDTMLTKLYDAQLKVLDGQSYSIAGRTFTMATLKDLNDIIADWENKVAEDEGENIIEVQGVIAVD